MSALSSGLPVPDAARLRADIDALAAMTRSELPYTRRARPPGPCRWHADGRGKDTLAAAAEVVRLVECLAREIGRGIVGTVGALDVRPNMVNVVPGHVELLADFRGIDPAAITETLGRFEAPLALWAVAAQ